MKSQIKQMFLSVVMLSIFSMGTIAMISSKALADPTPMTNSATQPTHTQHQWHKHCHGKVLRSDVWMGVPGDKKITPEDARIISQASLILHGQKQMKVGDIQTKATPKGFNVYVISLTDSQGKVVRHVVMNSRNGHVHLAH